MSRKGFVTIVLFMLTLCTAGAASALPLDPETAEAAGEGAFSGWWDKLMDWIDQVAQGVGNGLVGVEMDTCHLDPNGGGPICGGGS